MLLYRYLLLLGLTGTASFSTLRAQWQPETKLPATAITALLARGDTLYAAGLNTLFISVDAGQSWDTSAVIHPQLDYITDLWVSHGRIYVATVVDGVFVSGDHGQHWAADNNGLSGLGAGSIFMFAERGDQLYVATGGSGVFVKSLLNNGPWAPFNQGLFWNNVESIVHDQGRLLAGAGANARFSLQTGNDPWVEIPFATFTGESNILLGVVRDGDVLIGAGNLGLYRSEDDGAHWTHFNPGTGYLGFARFAQWDSSTLALLSKPVGASFLRQTTDQGETWNVFPGPSPAAYSYDLAVAGGQLFLARQDGLWHLQPSTAAPEPVARLPLPGVPNPASATAVIDLTAFAGESVRLTVFDAVGQFVLSQNFPGGEPATLDVQSWPAGAYFLQAESSGRMATGRLTKL